TRTPRWLGCFFQRPEMHRIHHQPGTEHLNYSDIPLWDMLFGTYLNPARFEGHCGFEPAREARLGDMLRFVDVHATGTHSQERT
ncbi:MAG: sterol desaturase family protein, partial [Betaproteobacteria bacterium]|nr:sterol desaturase family protein [Betaproteobacteria bacterium]